MVYAALPPPPCSPSAELGWLCMSFWEVRPPRPLLAYGSWLAVHIYLGGTNGRTSVRIAQQHLHCKRTLLNIFNCKRTLLCGIPGGGIAATQSLSWVRRCGEGGRESLAEAMRKGRARSICKGPRRRKLLTGKTVGNRSNARRRHGRNKSGAHARRRDDDVGTPGCGHPCVLGGEG